MRFCPSCGLDTADVGDPYVTAPPGGPTAPPAEPVTPAEPVMPSATTAKSESAPATAATALRRFAARSSRAPSVVVAALIVAAGLVAFALLMRPQPSVPASVSGGQVTPGGSAAPALITGLTFESPADGQVIATKDVTVIGLAPPGLTVTRDVSFGLDQHATADGTGHWAINVGLNDGENKLKFRLGDDRSTERELRITYTPPAP
jgi:hypothetical protein